MKFFDPRGPRLLLCLILLASSAAPALAGVSRAIQEQYRREYLNKALFLKSPVFSDKQYVFITGRNFRHETSVGAARLKVGDQVRVLNIDFGGDDIKFKVSPISGAGNFEIIFKFDADLPDEFPNRNVFESALQATFTEGLTYSDIEDAKRGYVEDQFDVMVRDLAARGNTSRESVLKALASRIPAYQDAIRDVENLKSRNQELSNQVSQLQAENRRLDTDLRGQQGEIARLKSANTSLQERIDSSAAQLARLGEDVRTARGLSQNYQREIANLQRSLNLKVDANSNLTSQIAELGSAMKKLQGDNTALESQNNALKANVEKVEAANKRLGVEIEDLKASGRQMRETISVLTSKEDSLARQYLQLKQVKEHLENVTLAVENVQLRSLEEKTEGGKLFRKVQVLLKNIPLGTLEWEIPTNLTQNQERPAVVAFSTESIDYVKVAAEERRILQSLGERFKIQVELGSPSSSIEVKPEGDQATQEIGERDRAVWRWRVANRGTQDARITLGVNLVNKNSDTVPLLRRDHHVASSNVVRQVRTYLQPIPVAIGTVFGFLLFGIVGIFRRAKRPPRSRGGPPTETGSYVRQKQL